MESLYYGEKIMQEADSSNTPSSDHKYALDFVPSASRTSMTSSPTRVNCGANNEDANDIQPWREALISRNLDLFNCCLEALLGDLLLSHHPYFGKLMTTVMGEIENITVDEVAPAAQSVFAKIGYKTQSPKLSGEEEREEDLKEGTQLMKIPNEEPYHKTNVEEEEPARKKKLKKRLKRKIIYGDPARKKKKTVKKQLKRKIPYGEPEPNKKGNCKKITEEWSFVCPACGRIVRNRKTCSPCDLMRRRVLMELSKGRDPIGCDHTDFSAAPECRTCRYHKYGSILKEMNEKGWPNLRNANPTSEWSNKPLNCLGCQKPLDENLKQCDYCFALVRSIIAARPQGHRVPTCNHTNYSGCPYCNKCRYDRFLKRHNIPTFQCGACKDIRTAVRCHPCHKFGTDLEESFGIPPVPQCSHLNQESDPSCVSCRYYLWKEGMKLPIQDEAHERPETPRFSDAEEESENFGVSQEMFEERIKIKQEMKMPQDFKRIKLEIEHTINDEIAL